MTDLKSALRAVERARAAHQDARRALVARVRELDDRANRGLDLPSVIDHKLVALEKAEAQAKAAYRAAQYELDAHAGPHVASLAGERLKVARAALAAIDALERAELADRKLQVDHAWAKPPAVVGELSTAVAILKDRLTRTIAELEGTRPGRAA